MVLYLFNRVYYQNQSILPNHSFYFININKNGVESLSVNELLLFCHVENAANILWKYATDNMNDFFFFSNKNHGRLSLVLFISRGMGGWGLWPKVR